MVCKRAIKMWLRKATSSIPHSSLAEKFLMAPLPAQSLTDSEPQKKRFVWVSCSGMSPQRACKDFWIWPAELKLLLRPKIIAVLLLFGGWQQENRWTMDIGNDFIDSLVTLAVFTIIPSTELQFHSNFLSKSINASKLKWKNLQHIS